MKSLKVALFEGSRSRNNNLIEVFEDNFSHVVVIFVFKGAIDNNVGIDLGIELIKGVGKGAQRGWGVSPVDKEAGGDLLKAPRDGICLQSRDSWFAKKIESS